MTSSYQVKDFMIDIPDDEIARCRRLIEDFRLPPQELFDGLENEKDPVQESGLFPFGASRKFLEEYRHHWLHDFDWKRDVQDVLNCFSQYTVEIEGVRLHFIHVKSKHSDAIPIILSHGWPGSVYEEHRLIEPLTNPQNGEQAFHVVVPSLPGFGWSSASRSKEWRIPDTARIFNTLMTAVLGYESYVAHGGDFGSPITCCLSRFDACKACHFTMLSASPPITAILFAPWAYMVPFFRKKYSEVDRKKLARTKWYAKNETAYMLQHFTKPSQIGMALNDSPMGLLAWMGEKYLTLTDHYLRARLEAEGQLPPNSLIKDTLASVSIYFYSQSFYTSVLPYYQMFSDVNNKLYKLDGSAPAGYTATALEGMPDPISWTKATHKGIVWVNEKSEGSHFHSLEWPSMITDALRSFFSQYH